MPNQELIDYIKQAREAGQDDDSIKSVLLQNGWSESDVFDALQGIEQIQSQTAEISSIIHQGKKSSKVVLITSVLLAVIFLGGGGAFVYFKFIKIQKTNKVIETVNKNKKTLTEQEEPTKKDINLQTMKLAKLPDGYTFPSFNDSYSLLGVSAERMYEHMVRFSDNGDWVSFLAQDKDKNLVTIVGFSNGEQMEFKGYTLVSGDGFKIANILKGVNGNSQSRVDIYNNKSKITIKGELYDRISGVAFNRGGSELMYIGMRGTQYFIILNNIPYGPYNNLDVSSLSFSYDGSKVAYIIDDKLVINGIVSSDSNMRVVSKPIFSPDSQKIAFIAYSGDDKIYPKVSVNVYDGNNTVQYKKWDGRLNFLTFSPDGNQIAYVASKRRDKNSEEFVVVNNEEKKIYHHIKFLTFNQSGKLSYLAESNSEQIIVIDDQEIRKYNPNEIYSIYFSSGDKLAYVTQGGSYSMRMVFGNRVSKSYKFINGFEGFVNFSSDGNNIAYMASSDYNKYFIVVGDRKTSTVDEFTNKAVFSLDGTKIAYGGKVGNGFWWTVRNIDELEFESWDGFVEDKSLGSALRADQDRCINADKPKGEPVWVKTPVNTETNVNFISFDLDFTSCPGAEGKYSLFIDGEEIGSILESEVLKGNQSYSFIFKEKPQGEYQLEIRIDPLNKTAKSEAKISNMQLGLVDLDQLNQFLQ